MFNGTKLNAQQTSCSFDVHKHRRGGLQHFPYRHKQFCIEKSVYIKEWQGSEVNKWYMYILIEFSPERVSVCYTYWC